MPTNPISELVSGLRNAMKRAEPLPWCWEQCGEKEDAPVVGVAFDEQERPIAGMLDGRYGDEILRWNVASDWGSGIDSSAPSANADFVVQAVNSLPTLLDAIERLERENADLRAFIDKPPRHRFWGAGEPDWARA